TGWRESAPGRWPSSVLAYLRGCRILAASRCPTTPWVPALSKLKFLSAFGLPLRSVLCGRAEIVTASTNHRPLCRKLAHKTVTGYALAPFPLRTPRALRRSVPKPSDHYVYLLRTWC